MDSAIQDIGKIALAGYQKRDACLIQLVVDRHDVHAGFSAHAFFPCYGMADFLLREVSLVLV